VIGEVRVIGDGMSGKGRTVNTADLSGQEGASSLTGVRAAVVALNPGNAGGAKGGRKADASKEGRREAISPSVPATDKQGEEDMWIKHKAKHGVWTEKMLEALQNGVKGKRWFSLMDKVCGERTLQMAWEQVQFNAGACGPALREYQCGTLLQRQPKAAARREGAPQRRFLRSQCC
jgi:RNA-directed DNA polymerase